MDCCGFICCLKSKKAKKTLQQQNIPQQKTDEHFDFEKSKEETRRREESASDNIEDMRITSGQFLSRMDVESIEQDDQSPVQNLQQMNINQEDVGAGWQALAGVKFSLLSR